MPTARHSVTGAVTYLYRTPDSAPSFADDVFGELLEWVRDHNTAQLGTDQFAYPVVAAEGSRESFYARVADYQGLSFLSACLPRSDCIEGVEQHDDVQGEIIANDDTGQNFEREGDYYSCRHRQSIGEKKPAQSHDGI